MRKRGRKRGGGNPNAGSGGVSGGDDFKEKYYQDKFGIAPSDTSGLKDKLVRSYAEGMEWVYRYYYLGIDRASWTWFFPFHYAPMASDLAECDFVEGNFNVGKPFRPFMQLLSCLPGDSAWALPKCYRELMTRESSPIIEFYPRDFEVDMNGKRNPWEAVNLLPFIDEQKLKSAVAEYCGEGKITEEERQRNEFGVDLVFQEDASRLEMVLSTFPGDVEFPAINQCMSSRKVYKLPSQLQFTPDLLPGCVADGTWEGDPHFTSLPVDAAKSELSMCGLNIFGREAKQKTFVLSVGGDAETTAGQLANQLLEQAGSISALDASVSPLPRLWANYPHLHEAVVDAVSDDFERVNFVVKKTNPGSVSLERFQLSSEDIKSFSRDAKLSRRRALAGWGLVGTGGFEIGEVKTMALVRPLVKMSDDPATGERLPVFAGSGGAVWIPSRCLWTAPR